VMSCPPELRTLFAGHIIAKLCLLVWLLCYRRHFFGAVSHVCE
jgi:hypothetical protein